MNLKVEYPFGPLWRVFCKIQLFVIQETYKDFNSLKLQICKSIIDNSISYPLTYSQLIRKYKYSMLDLNICNFIQSKLRVIEFCRTLNEKAAV